MFDMPLEVATMFERPGGNTHGNGKRVTDSGTHGSGV